MKIMVAEYAVGAGVNQFMLEGKAMLCVLVKSFVKCGHEVFYPTAGSVLESGNAVMTQNFEAEIPKIAKKCDAGLIIAPDEILGDLTEIVEDNTANLGCPSGSVRLCADKLKCTRILEKANIPVPETIERGEYEGDYVIKPRFGCASDGIYRSKKGKVMDDNIATRFIEGKHLSVSLITGKTQLILSVNRQLIEMNQNIIYKGGEAGYFCERNDELVETAKKASKILGCRGYSGVDIVLGDKPYVVDVNPRPTTSIIGITKLLNIEIADLILRSRFGDLPKEVSLKGSFTFKKEKLLVL